MTKRRPDHDELRLVEVREKIDQLSVVSSDDFNLPARYRALVALEAILVQRVGGRSAPPQSLQQS
ncbi:MAG: hypothetical protein QOD92_1081 [Acidimicrobiaceae bacterium]|jgi:hypothetical protein